MNINKLNFTFFKSLKYKHIAKFLFAFLSLSIYITYVFGKTYFNISLGADNPQYQTYVDYLFGNTDNTFNNQSMLYFFIVSLFIKLKSSYFTEENIYYLVSESVMEANTFLYLIGLYGLYLFIKKIDVNIETNFMLLIGLNFFPSIYILRINMKPEILAFAILPFLFIYYEDFILLKEYKSGFKLLIALSILFSTKGSVIGIMLLIILLLSRDLFMNIKIKKILTLLFIFILLMFGINFENSKFNDGSILERNEGIAVFDNVAESKIIYTFDFDKFIRDPLKNFQKDSMLAIVLLDTFGDYFELNWKEDASLFSKNVKDLVVEDLTNTANKRLSYDKINQFFTYSGQGQKYTKFYLIYFGAFLTVLYYLSLLYNLFKLNIYRYKIYSILPVLGLIVLLVNIIFGFPQNNYNPETSDTLKTFYYAFLIPYPFIFLLKNMKLKNYKIYLILLVLITYFFVNLGFPKSNSQEFDNEVNKNVEYSSTCFIDKFYFELVSVEDKKIICKIKTSNSDLSFYYQNLKKPYFNLMLFSLFFINLFYEYYNRIRTLFLRGIPRQHLPPKDHNQINLNNS